MKSGILKSLAIAIFTGFVASCSNGNDDGQIATYTVSVTATDGGTAVADRDTYTEGEEVVVTATADEGFSFLGWYDNEDEVATDGVYTLSCRQEMLYCRLVSVRIYPLLQKQSIWF